MRFKKFMPGPGAYEPKDYRDGAYFLSKYKSNLVRKFGTEKRLKSTIGNVGTPGPG
jgi:hypothetical protein